MAWCEPSRRTKRVKGGSPARCTLVTQENVETATYGGGAVGKRDEAGPADKFSVLAIADGKVFIATQTERGTQGLLQ